MAPVLAVGRAGYFYPRSPCGERHTWTRGSRITYVISIHALLAESDSLTTYLETSSIISIHALLAESDPPRVIREPATTDFYPRSPCGERLLGRVEVVLLM